VPEVLQVRRIGPDRVFRLGLGGKVLQPAEALLELAQALGVFERIGFCA